MYISIFPSKFHHRRGASMIEYGLLVGLIAGAAILGVATSGTKIACIFQNAADALPDVSTSTGCGTSAQGATSGSSATPTQAHWYDPIQPAINNGTQCSLNLTGLLNAAQASDQSDPNNVLYTGKIRSLYAGCVSIPTQTPETVQYAKQEIANGDINTDPNSSQVGLDNGNSPVYNAMSAQYSLANCVSVYLTGDLAAGRSCSQDPQNTIYDYYQSQGWASNPMGWEDSSYPD